MRILATVCLSLLLALPGATLSRAQLAPIDVPFSITSAEGIHSSPLLAARPDGSYLVVWKTEADSSRKLSGRFFGPGGSPLGSPFEIAAGPVESASVALLPDGGFVAAWEQGFEIRGSLHDRDGRVRVPGFQIVSGFTSNPAVAADAAGEWMVVWEEQGNSGDLNINGRWFGPDGAPRTPVVRLSRATPTVVQYDATVAALPGGGFLAAWNEIDRQFPGSDAPVVARYFPSAGVASGLEEAILEGGVPRLLPLPDGQGLLAESRPFGNPELVRLDVTGKPAGPAVRIPDDFLVVSSPIFDSAGRLLLLGLRGSSRLLGQLYDPTLLEPLGPAFEIPTAIPVSSEALLASAQPGQFLMFWESAGRLFGEIHIQDCKEPGKGLCLAEGRFRVEVSWSDSPGSVVKAHAVPLRDDTGSFWFFSPSNAELLIKILDGRGVNGHFWVFYGSLSDVAYEIRVTDRVTDEVRLYSNPAGTLASHADIRAFPLGATPAPAAAAPPAPAPWKLAAPPHEASVDCRSSDVALCLTSAYQVTVDFIHPETGESRQARALPFSQESGAFWFFGAANLELFVKVLDGTAINGHTWVFHGALSDVEYTLTVRGPDGAEWSYHNPRGRMHSGADTSALAGPAVN